MGRKKVKISEADRQKHYTMTKKDRGLVQVGVWITEADREKLKKYARNLRKKAGVPLARD